VRFFTPRRIPWVFVFLVLTLAVVYTAFLYLFVEFRRRLDEELGARLTAVASATAAAVDDGVWAGVASGDPVVLDAVRRELEEVRSTNDLSDIFLFDPEERTLLDVRGQFPEGDANPALAFDAVAVTAALAGLPAATRLYESGNTFLKSGYAPVLGDSGAVLGGVGIEASAGFFTALDRVRGTLLGAAGIVSVVVVLLGLGFARIQAGQTRLERRLRRAETLASMGQMAAMLAHEIRNPLGIIRGSAETLAEKYDLGEDEIYRFIPEEVDRLRATVTEYLDFARSGGEAAVEDAQAALQRTLHLVRRELERKGVELVADIQEGTFPVRGGARLEQAYLNLALNAGDAMPGGGRLRVGLTATEREVRIAFADTGDGMDEATRRKCLDPFFTTKERGSGLGLAVVSRVVEDCGGGMEIASRPGSGTTVTLVFPVAPPGPGFPKA